jgi:hypothetical protein
MAASSAPDVSAVVALCNKQYDLGIAGHTARAAEYCARALEAAEALGAPDCLIEATLQLSNAATILRNPAAMIAEGPEPAARKTTAVEHFVLATATLQRRRAAGTLMPGSCSAAEVTWRRQRLEHAQESKLNPMSAQAIAAVANLVGYEAFLQAASLTMTFICTMSLCGLSGGPRMRFCWDMLADAANLMAVPRANERLIVSSFEADFVQTMRVFEEDARFLVPTDAGCARALEAWHSLHAARRQHTRNRRPA